MGGSASATAVSTALSHPEALAEVEAAFKAFDKNGDGKLDAKEWHTFSEILLQRAAEAHQGSSSKANFLVAAGATDAKGREKWIADLLVVADSNHDGAITFSEFQAIIQREAHRNEFVRHARYGESKEWQAKLQANPTLLNAYGPFGFLLGTLHAPWEGAIKYTESLHATSLHGAVYGKHPEMIRVILAAGADRTLTSRVIDSENIGHVKTADEYARAKFEEAGGGTEEWQAVLDALAGVEPTPSPAVVPQTQNPAMVAQTQGPE